jgi:D-sedoheptulose 7-phosphate isomerase
MAAREADMPGLLARERGLWTAGLTGRGGGRLAGRVDVPVVVPWDSTPRIQEMHISLVHLICGLADEALFPRGGVA